MIGFDAPEWLLLALLLPPLVLWDLRRPWDGPRRGLAVAVRTALVLALVLSAAGPHLRTSKPSSEVVFVVDRSASVPDDALIDGMARVEALRGELSGVERPSLVLFDVTPELAVAPGERWRLPERLRPDRPVEATDIASALSLAIGLVPVDGAGRVVLLTDARPTDGALTPVLARARARRIPVHTIPLPSRGGEPGLLSFALDADEVRPGETVTGVAVVRGGERDRRAALRVHVGDDVVERVVDVPAGARVEVPFEHALPADATPGWIDVRARIEGDPDASRARLSVRRPPRVLAVVGQAAEAMPLRAALEAEGMEVSLVTPRGLAERLHVLSDVDLVVLGNVATDGEANDANRLPDGAADALVGFVRAGGGLVTLGGDRSYDNGGWQDSPLARVLPVEMDAPDVEIEPPASLLIVLDQSGSMGAFAGGATKMALANAGAVGSLGLLRPVDRFGVLAYDDEPEWAVPLAPVRDRDAVARRVRAIPADGGGIFVYSSLLEARDALRRAPTPVKHVILFCDARDAEEKTSGRIMGWGSGESSLVLAERMRREGITTSVIAIGTASDPDAGFLEDLAAAGGGRHYRTADARTLRALFVKETQRLVRANVREQPFRAQVRAEHPALAGVSVDTAPPLGGLVELTARPTADVVLTDGEDRPVLATWRYGLGQVAAFTIDAGPRLAPGWLDWEGYPRLWTQLARWAARDRPGEATAIEVENRGGGTVLRIARRDDGAARAGALTVRLVDEDAGASERVRAELVEPGLWEARVKTRPDAAYRVEAVGPDGEIVARRGFVRPGGGERRHDTADLALLERIAGETGGDVDGAVEGPIARRSAVHPLWSWLALLAALLLPFDAFLRRDARR